jgi:hypothetical protein
MKRTILITAAMLLAVPAMADPYGIHRPRDIELFKQDMREANKFRAIKAREQRQFAREQRVLKAMQARWQREEAERQAREQQERKEELAHEQQEREDAIERQRELNQRGYEVKKGAR